MRRLWLLTGLLIVGLAAVQPVMAQGGGPPPRVPITEDTYFQLKIPALALDIPVFEAWMNRRTWEFRVLTEEAGHLQYTAYPGMRGNVVIGGHYELADFGPGPFHELDQLKRGDTIEIVYLGQTYRYQVVATALVSPRDLRVIQPTPYEALTLLTCYDYSPQAETYTQRYVVRAVRFGATPAPAVSSN